MSARVLLGRLLVALRRPSRVRHVRCSRRRWRLRYPVGVHRRSWRWRQHAIRVRSWTRWHRWRLLRAMACGVRRRIGRWCRWWRLVGSRWWKRPLVRIGVLASWIGGVSPGYTLLGGGWWCCLSPYWPWRCRSRWGGHRGSRTVDGCWVTVPVRGPLCLCLAIWSHWASFPFRGGTLAGRLLLLELDEARQFLRGELHLFVVVRVGHATAPSFSSLFPSPLSPQLLSYTLLLFATCTFLFVHGVAPIPGAIQGPVVLSVTLPSIWIFFTDSWQVRVTGGGPISLRFLRPCSSPSTSRRHNATTSRNAPKPTVWRLRKT